jgi:hypothetical protein
MKIDLDNTEIEMAADQVLWITANKFSVRVMAREDGGVKVAVWPLNREDGDSLVTVDLPASCGST